MSSLAPPIGWGGPKTCDVRWFNRTGGALAVGALVVMDEDNSATESTNSEIGDPASGFAAAVVPATADLEAGIFGVVLQAAADDAQMLVRLRGNLDVMLVTGATALGDLLVAADGLTTVSVAGVPVAKVIAKARGTTAGAGSIAASFNGIEGFGNAA